MSRKRKPKALWCATTAAEGLDQTCGGSRLLDCFCGGDLCVCGNYGQIECYGCKDCDYDDDDEFDEPPEPQMLARRD